MEKLLNSLQSKLVKLEMSELSEITKFSQDEAVRLTLMLAAQPAPPMPEFQLDPIYQDADKLADAIDDVFSTTGDKDDYEVEEKKKWEEFDDYDDKVKKKDVDEKDKAMTLTDAEATAICTDWMIKYSVVQGVSWGNLPFDLQQKWLSYSCDYHFGKINSPTPTLYPASPPSFESVY